MPLWAVTTELKYANLWEFTHYPILKMTLDSIAMMVYDTGLYGDDGLILLRKLNGQQTDKIRKSIIKVFKTLGLQTKLETNLHEVNFLDITFIFRSGTYRPYKKSDDKL